MHVVTLYGFVTYAISRERALLEHKNLGRVNVEVSQPDFTVFSDINSIQS